MQRRPGVLLHQKDGGSLVVQNFNDSEYFRHEHWGEAHGGFIQDEQFGPRHEGPCDSHHLLFPAAQGAGQLLGSNLEEWKYLVYPIKSLLNFSLGSVAVVQIGPQMEIVQDGQMGKELPAFRDLGNAQGDDLDRRKGGYFRSFVADGTALRLDEAGNRFQKGCFTRAIGADNGYHAAGRNGHGNILQRLDISIEGRHPSQLKHNRLLLPDRLR